MASDSVKLAGAYLDGAPRSRMAEIRAALLLSTITIVTTVVVCAIPLWVGLGREVGLQGPQATIDSDFASGTSLTGRGSSVGTSKILRHYDATSLAGLASAIHLASLEAVTLTNQDVTHGFKVLGYTRYNSSHLDLYLSLDITLSIEGSKLRASDTTNNLFTTGRRLEGQGRILSVFSCEYLDECGYTATATSPVSSCAYGCEAGNGNSYEPLPEPF